MGRWEDLYKILQVHYDAEQEVIEGAYKKLCKKYHPDVNKSSYAQEKIKKINAAYEILKDPQKRKAFHSEWLSRNRSSYAAGIRTGNQWKSAFDDIAEETAQNVLNDYLTALSHKKYAEAFKLLTDCNKRTISYEDFLEWQESVAQLYSIGNFRTRVFKKGNSRIIAGILFMRYIEFEIDASEKNLRTGVVSSYHFTKTIVFENNQWRIFLEYTDLKFLIYKFKFLCYIKEKGNLIDLIAELQLKKDEASGLLNKRGFIEELEKENNRFLRYKSIFTIAVFSISLKNGSRQYELEKEQLEGCAFYFKRYARNTDIVAHFGNGIFGVIFIETDCERAEAACRKIVRELSEDAQNYFKANLSITYGIHEHNGREVMDSLNEAFVKAGLSSADWDSAGYSNQKSILF